MKLDYANLKDVTLIDLVKQADHDALGALYDRYGRLVYSTAYSVVSQHELATEITQDVFLRIWQKAETYQPEQGKLITWIASITRYRAIDVLRRQSVRPEGNTVSWDLQEIQGLSDGTKRVEEQVELSLRSEKIRVALSALPEEQRAALLLAYFRGYSTREIAEELGEPLGTIKTRLRLGMQKLRGLLGEM
jgi:RNA polymerase sigma-70 factor (ECF subfamily)